jgi:hypothetical protein
MPCPWEQYVVPLHSLESSVDVNPRGRETVADVQRAIHVRKREGDESFLPVEVRVRFKDPPFFPYCKPIFLVFGQDLFYLPWTIFILAI